MKTTFSFCRGTEPLPADAAGHGAPGEPCSRTRKSMRVEGRQGRVCHTWASVSLFNLTKEALSLDSTSTVFMENPDDCWGGRHPPPLLTQQGQSTGRSQSPLSRANRVPPELYSVFSLVLSLMLYWMGQRVLKDPSEPCGSYTPGLGPKCGRDLANPGILGPTPCLPYSSLASFREPLL